MVETNGICVERSLDDGMCLPDQWYHEFNRWRYPAVYTPVSLDPLVEGSLTTTGFSFSSLIAQTAKQTAMWGYEKGFDNFDNNNTLLLSFDEVELDRSKVVKTKDKIDMVCVCMCVCG